MGLKIEIVTFCESSAISCFDSGPIFADSVNSAPGALIFRFSTFRFLSDSNVN